MTDAQHLAGQVAIVTGASQGIGEAVARHLARLGIHLVLCARNVSKLEALSQQLRIECPDVDVLTHACDVRDPAQVQAVADETIQRFNRIDILINNAGVAPKVGLLQEMSIEDIDWTIDTNLKGAIYCMRAVLPAMVHQHSGVIININSTAGKTAYPYWGLYDASKFGLDAITQAVADEQRGNNIKVVGLYPGAVNTAIWDGLHMEREPDHEGMLDAESIADAVDFILRQPRKVFIPQMLITPLRPVV